MAPRSARENARLVLPRLRVFLKIPDKERINTIFKNLFYMINRSYHQITLLPK